LFFLQNRKVLGGRLFGAVSEIHDNSTLRASILTKLGL